MSEIDDNCAVKSVLIDSVSPDISKPLVDRLNQEERDKLKEWLVTIIRSELGRQNWTPKNVAYMMKDIFGSDIFHIDNDINPKFIKTIE